MTGTKLPSNAGNVSPALSLERLIADLILPRHLVILGYYQLRSHSSRTAKDLGAIEVRCLWSLVPVQTWFVLNVRYPQRFKVESSKKTRSRRSRQSVTSILKKQSLIYSTVE